MGITPENMVELPVRPYGEDVPRVYDDDTWYQKESFWKQDKYDFFDTECESALIAEGIGLRACPTIGEWAAFVIAGAVIAALTGKYIIAPGGTKEGMANRIWVALWRASEKNGEKFDRKFLATMLRSFFPRSRYCQSNFAHHWEYFEYPDALFRSIGNVRQERLRVGLEAIKNLEKPVIASIREVTPHVPRMLEIANKQVRSSYMW